MILQRDELIRKRAPEYADEGCYVHCLLFIANMLTNRAFTAVHIARFLYPRFIEKGWIKKNCYVLDPCAILAYFGVPVTSVRKEAADYACSTFEREILHWEYALKGWHHFTVGNGAGVVTFDPWGVSVTATKGTLKSKRVFTLEG